jgi:hypothetical protein
VPRAGSTLRWLAIALPLLANGLAAGQQPPQLRLGSFDVSVNWRARGEGWGWFEGGAGNSHYTLEHSLLRLGVGRSGERVAWFVEGAQVTILGLPTDAVAPAPMGQLGLGATYYVANGSHVNNAGVFLKQAFVDFKALGPVSAKLGRFEYFDGLEVQPKDPQLADVVRGRIAHRLISNFAFTAVQRTFDGGQVSWTAGPSNVTLFAARPTAGIFQVQGMDELRIEVYSGAYTGSIATPGGAGQLRLFALGYVDDRTSVLKTDNRSPVARAADSGKVALITLGLSYAHVINTRAAGKFDLVVWGAWQGGSWGALTQQAGAYVAEVGWQPVMTALRPWIRAGYSYGSGDGDPKDTRHGTFFQVLTTPRQYARFPFYNMMNNRDVYATVDVRPIPRLALRSEAHALRLASGADLWYVGGGAFQPGTFGYTGRPSGGTAGLATVWDLSADCALTRNVAVTLYYGHAWGKGVITNIYPTNPDAHLLFLETVVRF